MRGKTGKRLVTNDCFLLCKKLGAICSVGGVFKKVKALSVIRRMHFNHKLGIFCLFFKTERSSL